MVVQRQNDCPRPHAELNNKLVSLQNLNRVTQLELAFCEARDCRLVFMSWIVQPAAEIVHILDDTWKNGLIQATRHRVDEAQLASTL